MLQPFRNLKKWMDEACLIFYTVKNGGKLLDLEHSLIYEPDNAWTCLTDGTYKYIYFTFDGRTSIV